MNITKILFFATAFTMLLISCDREELNEAGLTRSHAEGIGYACVYLEDATSILTKSVEEHSNIEASEEERKIHNLSFFVFNANGERDIRNNYQTFNYTGNQYTFPVTAGEGKIIIGAANVQYLGNLGDADLETVRLLLTNAVATRTGDTLVNGAAMAGEALGVNATKGDVKVIKMQVSRTYSR